MIYGNIQLVKHTDDLDPDVSEGENTDEPNEGIVERPEADAVFEVYLKAAAAMKTQRKASATCSPRTGMDLPPLKCSLTAVTPSTRQPARKARR